MKGITLALICFVLLASVSSAAWWNSSFSNKIEIDLVNWTCSAYTCQFPIYFNGQAGTSVSGWRFTNAQENALVEYWAEPGNFTSGVGNVWLNLTNGTTKTFLYYNNSAVTTNLSNATTVFPVYMNFSGTYEPGRIVGGCSVTSGKLIINAGGPCSIGTVTLPGNKIEMKVAFASAGSSIGVDLQVGNPDTTSTFQYKNGIPRTAFSYSAGASRTAIFWSSGATMNGSVYDGTMTLLASYQNNSGAPVASSVTDFGDGGSNNNYLWYYIAKGYDADGINPVATFNPASTFTNQTNATYIHCYDEKNDSAKTFTANVYSVVGNTIANTFIINQTSVGWFYTSDLNGTKNAYVTCTNGTQRLYVLPAPNGTLNSRSLLSSLGSYYTFVIENQFGSAVSNAVLTASRFSSMFAGYTTVEQCISNPDGTCTLFLEPLAAYNMNITSTTGSPIYFSFTPGTTTSITVAYPIGTLNVTVTSSYDILNDTTYYITPLSSSMNNSHAPFNTTFTVNSIGGILTMYGMKVTSDVYGNVTTLFQQNVTTSTTGGFLNYTITPSNYNATTITVIGYFTVQGYPNLLQTQQVQYQIYQNSSLYKQLQDNLAGSLGISGFVYMFMSLLIAVLISSWALQYGRNWAVFCGWIFLAWMGFVLNPNAVVLTMWGNPVTVYMLTGLATLLALSGLILTNNI